MANPSRRQFVAASAAVACGPACVSLAAPGGRPLKKALIQGIPTEASLTPLKEAGFDGIECQAWNAAPAQAEQGRMAAEKLGMKIHSVMRGWASFNDPSKMAEGIASMEKALETARILGADTVLLVPCRTAVKPIPKPWEFDIRFDEKTAHVSQVVAGDNEPFRKYIETQNQATDLSREALGKLIPAAEKNGVVIAVENVWNNFWVKPDLFASFVRSCNSKWIQAYFDIGNHVKYAPSEEWILTLGDLIAKCHVKDFQLNPNGQGGKFVNIREGSVNWPAVMQALDKIKYKGWMTIEGSGKLPVAEQGKRLDRIIAGE
ncbi:MAG: sugar phosphate isomerase/epimerase [Verrucomicrobia bacterium]|nr:sugar phosphate isomerase/epimerase [Verrucomicrobiota bacterium]